MNEINLLVTGSKTYANYGEFFRAIGVAIDALRDPENDGGKINVYTIGPSNINSFTAEFCNVSEKTLRSYGYKIKFFRVPWSKAVHQMSSWDIDKVITFGIKNPHSVPAVVQASLTGIGVLAY